MAEPVSDSSNRETNKHSNGAKNGPGDRDHSDAKTDAATLGGGVVAIAMTMFANPGRYDIIGAAVALTLLVLVFAYVGAHPRERWSQKLAFGAVIGILSIPLLGLVAELLPWVGVWTDTGPRDLWCSLHWTECAHPGVSAAEPSTVSSLASVIGWLIISLLVAWGDPWSWPWISKKPD